MVGTMRKLILILLLAFVSNSAMAAEHEDYYFSCTGTVGVAENQSMLPLQSRAITSANSKVKGSMHITDKRVTIDGIPWLASENAVCENSNQVLWFNSDGLSEHCSGNDIYHKLGLFNKVTGILIYHEGDSLAIFQCKKSKKLMK